MGLIRPVMSKTVKRLWKTYWEFSPDTPFEGIIPACTTADKLNVNKLKYRPIKKFQADAKKINKLNAKFTVQPNIVPSHPEMGYLILDLDIDILTKYGTHIVEQARLPYLFIIKDGQISFLSAVLSPDAEKYGGFVKSEIKDKMNIEIHFKIKKVLSSLEGVRVPFIDEYLPYYHFLLLVGLQLQPYQSWLDRAITYIDESLSPFSVTYAKIQEYSNIVEWTTDGDIIIPLNGIYIDPQSKKVQLRTGKMDPYRFFVSQLDDNKTRPYIADYKYFLIDVDKPVSKSKLAIAKLAPLNDTGLYVAVPSYIDDIEDVASLTPLILYAKYDDPSRKLLDDEEELSQYITKMLENHGLDYSGTIKLFAQLSGGDHFFQIKKEVRVYEQQSFFIHL